MLWFPRERQFRNAVTGKGYVDYANVSSLTGLLIAHNKATLHELETIYSYRDALNMAEVIAVQNYNEWVALEEAKKR